MPPTTGGGGERIYAFWLAVNLPAACRLGKLWLMATYDLCIMKQKTKHINDCIICTCGYNKVGLTRHEPRKVQAHEWSDGRRTWTRSKASREQQYF